MHKMTRQRITEYEVEIPESLEGFINWEFSSGTTIGEDFSIFASKFRSYIKKNLPDNSELKNFNVSHYELFGFIHRNGKYVDFSISDVRHFPNEWYEDILIRTAENDQDYSGGDNCSTNLKDFKINVERLLKE